MDRTDATNYYEHLIENYLTENAAPRAEITDNNLLIDITCLALNLLPPLYFHHEVNMALFLSDEELELMQAKVCLAVESAIEKVINNPR